MSSIVAYSLPRDVFTASLLSNGSLCHSIHNECFGHSKVDRGDTRTQRKAKNMKGRKEILNK